MYQAVRGPSLARFAGAHYLGSAFSRPESLKALFPDLLADHSPERMAAGEGLRRVLEAAVIDLPNVLPAPDPEVYLGRLRLLIHNMELSRCFFPGQDYPGKLAVLAVRGNKACRRWRRFCQGDFVLHEIDISQVAPFSRHASFIHAENVTRFMEILEGCLEPA